MKHTLIFLIALLFAQSLSAQMGMGKPKEIKELGNRKMVVITSALPKKAADKLKKKGKTAELAEIQKLYDSFNATVKDVMAERWTMHKTVEYKTWEEFKKMPDKKREKYGVLYFMSKQASRFSAGDISAGYLVLTPDMGDEKITDHNFASLFQTCTIDKAEDVPVDKIKFNATPVYGLTLPEVFPTALSIAFAITSINGYFEHRLSGEKVTRKKFMKEVAANSTRLKDKTLLVRDDWKDKELTLGQIKALYKHPVRVVSAKELEEAVMARDSQYAWFVVLPVVNSNSRTTSVIFAHQIVDNVDGDVLGMYIPSMGSMMLKAYAGGTSGKDRMTEKTLKEMVEGFGKEGPDTGEEEEKER